MLILLHGQDTYRSRQKLNGIIERYKKIHKSGLNLIWQKEIADIKKIKELAESVSMFNEKKLIIIEDALQDKTFKEDFLKYAKEIKLKENKDIIIVLSEKNKFQATKIKSQVNMSQEFKSLNGFQLTNWIEKEVKKQDGQIDKLATQKLASYLGNDLWQASNEIAKLIHFEPKITSGNIDLLIKPKIDNNIFQTIDSLAEKNKKNALLLLHKHLNQGENEIYLLTMLTYQFRNLIKLKSLIEQNTPYYNLAKKTKLYPFVVKKAWNQLRNFSLSELKQIYKKLLEIEVNIKKGLLQPRVALDLLVAEI